MDKYSDKTVITLTTIFLILSAVIIMALIISAPQYECVKWHTEEYYDNSGIALWLTTKNPAFLGQNGWKTKLVCDEYQEIR